MNADRPPPSSPVGVPAGLLDDVLAILERSGGPVRRRKLLEELDRRGRRVSLAGLNRALDHALRAGLTRESPEGVRPRQPEG